MKPITLKLGERELPCSPTMGAALLYHERTGKEVTEVDMTKPSELMPYLFACVEVGCRREHKSLEMTYEEFCDETSTADLQEWQKKLFDLMAEDASKKKATTPQTRKKAR